MSSLSERFPCRRLCGVALRRWRGVFSGYGHYEDAMVKAQSSFDLIIDTVSTQHDVSPYMPLLELARFV